MHEPIRILQVFAQMNRGGAETMIMDIYRHIDRSKIQFDFIVHTQEKCAFDEEIIRLGGRIHVVSKYTVLNDFKYKKEWSTFFKRFPGYKIIHGHCRSTASIYLKIAKKHNLVTIAHSHSTSSGVGIKALVKKVLQYKIKYIADFLFACSKSAGKWLYGKKAIKKNNFYLLNNAIDTKKFVFNNETRERKRRELNLQENYIVGHIGRFVPVKNHKFLIEIFKEFKKTKNNAVLILAGDGKTKYQIEKKVKTMNLIDSVIFLGMRSDISELLQAMDVLVFPSLYEGLPLTLVEAQASGLPCIVSNTISAEIFIAKSIKSIALKLSTKQWADSINELTNNYVRTNNYLEIRKAGYDIESTTKWIEEFYLGIE